MKFPIAFVNQSTVATDSEVQILMGHLQTQVSRDFSPIWGVDAQLTFIPKGVTPPATSWQLVFLDDADQAGALGYHELTMAGLPLGKVFVRTSINNKSKWSVTASHELLEMLVDPNINLSSFIQTSNNSGIMYAYEVCDAVEDDRFGYPIYSAIVSNFVTPAWFEPVGTVLSPKFDFRNVLTQPLQLAVNGYIGTFDVTAGTGWQQTIRVGEIPAVEHTQQDPRLPIRLMGIQNWRRSLR
jgi:hypothetical protein